jgi:hypothetical protein
MRTMIIDKTMNSKSVFFFAALVFIMSEWPHGLKKEIEDSGLMLFSSEDKMYLMSHQNVHA